MSTGLGSLATLLLSSLFEENRTLKWSDSLHGSIRTAGAAPGKTNLKLSVAIKPVIPAWGQGWGGGEMRQENDHKFEASLSYIVGLRALLPKPCLLKSTKELFLKIYF